MVRRLHFLEQEETGALNAPEDNGGTKHLIWFLPLNLPPIGEESLIQGIGVVVRSIYLVWALDKPAQGGDQFRARCCRWVINMRVGGLGSHNRCRFSIHEPVGITRTSSKVFIRHIPSNRAGSTGTAQIVAFSSAVKLAS